MPHLSRNLFLLRFSAQALKSTMLLVALPLVQIPIGRNLTYMQTIDPLLYSMQIGHMLGILIIRARWKHFQRILASQRLAHESSSA